MLRERRWRHAPQLGLVRARMPTYLAVAFGLLAALVIGSLVYAVLRLLREPPPRDAVPRAQRLARLMGIPTLFDGLLARPLTRREKLGWLVVGVLIALAVALTPGRR